MCNGGRNARHVVGCIGHGTDRRGRSSLWNNVSGMEHASITFERHHSVISSLQYSNLYYVAPVFFRAHRNIFSQFVQYWTETAAESAYAKLKVAGAKRQYAHSTYSRSPK
jgi:hypothetical protein